MSTADRYFLHKALELAEIRRGFCAPNPAVGAVIVQGDKIISSGYHKQAGQPHAEIEALKQTSENLSDATVYITLEPCCHYGKTPPCTEALIQSKVKRVVYGYRDPNPLVAGKGEQALQKAGITCEHVFLPEIKKFYESYTYWQQTQKPFVTGKIALTLDGKIAAENGKPLPITGEDLKEWTHHCRKKSDAILTTAQTIIADDPKLTARTQNEIITKPIYILDSQLRLPLNARILKTAQRVTLFHASTVSKKSIQAMEALNIRCIPVEITEKGLNLKQVIEWIGKDGIHDLWLEAGGKVFSSFVQEKLLQKIYLYIAPWALGSGLSAFSSLMDFREYEINWRQLGKDVLCEMICSPGEHAFANPGS